MSGNSEIANKLEDIKIVQEPNFRYYYFKIQIKKMFNYALEKMKRTNSNQKEIIDYFNNL